MVSFERAVPVFAFDQVFPVRLGQAGPPLGLLFRAGLEHAIHVLLQLLAVGLSRCRLRYPFLQPVLGAAAQVLDFVQDAGPATATAAAAGRGRGLFLFVCVLQEQLGVVAEAGCHPLQAGAVVAGPVLPEQLAVGTLPWRGLDLALQGAGPAAEQRGRLVNGPRQLPQLADVRAVKSHGVSPGEY
ncbi:hypothetical protein [Pseudarthrobacter sp. MDT1-22]